MQVSYNNESNIRVKILKEERMRKGFEEKYRECSLGNERCKKHLSLLFWVINMQVSYNNESNIRIKILIKKKKQKKREGFEGKYRECSLGNERCKKHCRCCFE